jgi:hypothetical protein
MHKTNLWAHGPSDNRPSHPREELRSARGVRHRLSTNPPRSWVDRPLEWGSVSLEGRKTLERDSAPLEGWTPPRARPRLDREPNAPSSEFPSRSRASRATAPIPAPPVGAFNALTPAGVQVKGESTPLCARESRPAAALPTPVARPSPPLCDAVRHGQQPPRGTVLPTPVRPVHRTLEKGRWKPRRDDA